MTTPTQSNDEPVLGTIQYGPTPAARSHMPTQLTSDQSRLIMDTADLVKQLASKVQYLEDENQRLFFEMERWKVEAHQLAQEKDRLIDEDSEEYGDESEESEDDVGGKHTDSLEAIERQIETESEHVKVGPFVEEDRGPMQDRTLQDLHVQGSPMQADTALEVLPSIEQPPKLQTLYAVVHRHGELCDVKGTFSTVDQANEAAGIVLANEYPNCIDYAFIERGHSQDPWRCSDEEIGEAQRRLGSDGEVRFAVDEENDGVGYVVVLRQELDVQPQRREDPVPGPLPTWSPPPMIRSYAQNVELSDHEPEGPWWQPKPSTDQPWDMDYNPTDPFYSQEAIAERERQRELLGLNHHPSIPPASSTSPLNTQGSVPQRRESLGILGLPASAYLDPERGILRPEVLSNLSFPSGLDIQMFGSARTGGARSSPKPRKPRSDRGVPRKGRSGKRGRRAA
ncbi:hypothetical protein D0864_04681 [Hortaea werneckii]|uniref:Uncharacterized protein n=1 Tax=Hortaea werneckii TaxID=91943 RepID=A0A3M7GEZ8_HORWE|nr:hypothetical protein D0864_04681 [Hortaea werneckii]RMY99417.1 hypothetical protein D0862_07138 [Hortaea werneckii]